MAWCARPHSDGCQGSKELLRASLFLVRAPWTRKIRRHCGRYPASHVICSSISARENPESGKTPSCCGAPPDCYQSATVNLAPTAQQNEAWATWLRLLVQAGFIAPRHPNTRLIRCLCIDGKGLGMRVMFAFLKL